MMADYQAMYKTLFQAVTQAVDILNKAQQETEEMYISAEMSILRLVSHDNPDAPDSVIR